MQWIGATSLLNFLYHDPTLSEEYLHFLCSSGSGEYLPCLDIGGNENFTVCRDMAYFRSGLWLQWVGLRGLSRMLCEVYFLSNYLVSLRTIGGLLSFFKTGIFLFSYGLRLFLEWAFSRAVRGA